MPGAVADASPVENDSVSQRSETVVAVQRKTAKLQGMPLAVQAISATIKKLGLASDFHFAAIEIAVISNVM
ncbi:hypothetical protein [Rhizorhabdus argentea]|uniref:hypothetical protein n=1 Tax=Rhizorhabdus argentea TaxID=1387174 RepID=UPI0030EE39C6